MLAAGLLRSAERAAVLLSLTFRMSFRRLSDGACLAMASCAKLLSETIERRAIPIAFEMLLIITVLGVLVELDVMKRVELILIIGIQVLEDSRCIIKDFFWLEEAVQLNNCIFGRIRGVNNVLLETHTEIPTDSSRGSLS